jgi:CheY-like chemotaxis protein
VHGIVKSHHGEISVESRPGEGTTFHICFPLFIEKYDDQAAEPKNVARGNAECILFVDDEELLSEMTRDLLEDIGYRVTAKINGRDALEAFLSDPGRFDLVITDYTMPGMNGMELAKEIIRVRPDMPIILCTGYSYMLDREKLRKAGIRDIVIKPVLRHTIADAIKRALTD